MRQAAADVLAGMSLRQIARRWNTEGVTSVRGAAWNTGRLMRMLVNPRYAGIRTYNGRETAPGKWAAIIDTDTHRGLVSVLRDPTRGAAVSYERKYIGSYRYLYGRCGAKMQHTVSTHANGKSFHNYRCTAATHLSRSQPELDAYVEQVALQYLRRGEALADKLSDNGNEIDVNELRTRRTALQARLDDLAGLFAEGAIDASQLKRGSAELRTKVSAIDTTLAELALTSPLAAMTADGAEEIEKRWEAASPDMRGKVIDELFTVVVQPAPRGRYFKREFIEFAKPRRA
ncbi:recombinase family protein [Mycobacterium sp. pW049]|uniref:recombinase family protein n=1 Tax=[Mycobacterium] bulgaricum TaxID=3238985 RepID=UPI00351BC373